MNENQIICQKTYLDTYYNKTVAYTLAISHSASPASCNLLFTVQSGSLLDSVTGSIEKGKFNHISAVFNRDNSINRLKLYKNSNLILSSANELVIGDINTNSKYNICKILSAFDNI